MIQAGTRTKWVFPVLMAVLGLCFYNMAILGTGLEYVPGDSGDSRFINYLLEHGHQYLQGHHAFWDAPFMYPQKNVLAFSDNMMGTLPVYSFFRLLGNDRETAYQLWWIIISLLNFIGCYLVLQKITENRFAAALGAFIFAFGLFNQSQMSYLQMNIRFAVPFIFYYAWQMVVQPSLKNYLQYCLWLLIQFYSIIYTGILAFYLSFFFIVVVAFVYRKWNFVPYYLQRKNLLRTLAIGLVTALGLYVLLKPYIDISHITGLRMFWTVVPTLPTLGSWFFAHESSYTWHFLSQHLKDDTREWFLHNIYPGLLPLFSFTASGMILLYQRIKKQSLSKKWLVFFLLSALIFLLFTRLDNGYTLYALIFKLPGMNSLRVLSRIMHIQLFFLVVLFALLVTAVLKQDNKKKIYAFGFLLFAGVMADNAFDPTLSLRTPKQDLQQRIANLKSQVEKQKEPQHKILALVNQSGDHKAYLTHLDAMLVAQELHMPCINAYTSYCPDDYGPFFLNPTSEGLQKWMRARNINPGEVLVIEVK